LPSGILPSRWRWSSWQPLQSSMESFRSILLCLEVCGVWQARHSAFFSCSNIYEQIERTRVPGLRPSGVLARVTHLILIDADVLRVLGRRGNHNAGCCQELDSQKRSSHKIPLTNSGSASSSSDRWNASTASSWTKSTLRTTTSAGTLSGAGAKFKMALTPASTSLPATS